MNCLLLENKDIKVLSFPSIFATSNTCFFPFPLLEVQKVLMKTSLV